MGIKNLSSLELASTELKTTLEGLVRHLFGECEIVGQMPIFLSLNHHMNWRYFQGRVVGGSRLRSDAI